jgi:hypothetical protein
MAKGARVITRVRKPKVDKLSTSSATTTDELRIIDVIILPREGYETERGWVTYEGWEIFILPSSRVVPPTPEPRRAYVDGDIVATDLIRIDGVLWQVDGPPAPYDKGAVRKATRIRVKKVGS